MAKDKTEYPLFAPILAAGLGGNQSNHISMNNNNKTQFHSVFLLTVLQKRLRIGVRKSSPIYDEINQLEEVIKNRCLNVIGSLKANRHITLITIQNKQINARLNKLVFLGTVEKYPLIRVR